MQDPSTGYFRTVNNHLRFQQGAELAEDLELELMHKSNIMHEKIVGFLSRSNIEREVEDKLAEHPQWIHTFAEHLTALVHMRAKRYADAAEAQLRCHSAVCKFLEASSDTGGWVIPAFMKISEDLRKVAVMADTETGSVEQEKLSRASEQIQKAFVSLNRSRAPVSEEGSKKRAIFQVTNLLLKIYFKMNNLNQCKVLIKSIERLGEDKRPLPDSYIAQAEMFDKSDVVAYKFYVGRLRMFQDDYESARECLNFALRHCAPTHIRNIRRILQYLIPVNLFLGKLPRMKMLERYKLDEFVDLTTAVRTGNVRLFNNALEQHQLLFIRKGVYLVIEKARALLYRNLFKRSWQLLQQNPRIELVLLEEVLRWLGEDVEANEVDCIVANLIYDKHIKGCINLQRRILVLSKRDAFPRLSPTAASVVFA